MAKNPLNVISVESKPEPRIGSKINYREEAERKFDYLWKIYPQQFNPLRNCMEEERINRTVELIQKHMDLNGKKVADLGCGTGILARRLSDLGAHIDAIDIATEPLHQEDTPSIRYMRDYVPRTKLADDAYDLVIGSELIAYLHHDEYRLFMAEMARLVKPSGMVVCSTPLDIHSEDPIQRFNALSETEFQIDDWAVSHHSYWIRIYDFFAAPERFTFAAKNNDYRNMKLAQRTGFSNFWFKINSSYPLAYFWTVVQYLSKPIYNYVRTSRSLLLRLEKICRSISSIRGISHAIWIGKRRPLVEFTPLEDQPKERKGKKQVWE